MKNTSFGTLCVGLMVTALGSVMATTPSDAAAQTASAGDGTSSTVLAQQQYNLDLAVCNNAGFPAPQREACVRDAGLRLDRVRGMPASHEPQASADGRATVMTPSPRSSSLRGSEPVTTSDGRATVVVPMTGDTR